MEFELVTRPGETTDEEDLMEDVIEELTRKASIGRVLILLDGLDEVHGVGTLAEIKPPAGMLNLTTIFCFR